MAEEMALRRMVYSATAIAIGVTAIWAFMIMPRLTTHPQAVANGVDQSSKLFFAIQLMAAVVLLAVIIQSRHGRRIIGELLYLAAALIVLHDLMVFDGAIYYLEEYSGFAAMAILMLGCVGANLIAGVLAIAAGNKSRRLRKAK